MAGNRNRKPRISPDGAAKITIVVEVIITCIIVTYRNNHGVRVFGVVLLAIVFGLMVRLIVKMAKRQISSPALLVSFLAGSISCIIPLFAVQYVGAGLKNTTLNLTVTKFPDCLYFAVVTWTTLGYGDLLPVTRTARWWAGIEVLAGYVTMGLLISVLVVVFQGTITPRK